MSKERTRGKIKTLEDLVEIAKQLRLGNKKIVWINGIFNSLNALQYNSICQAREQGDILIVGVNSDESVRKLQRGIEHSENERADFIAGLEHTSYVIVFPETDCCHCLQTIKPDVYVKGDNYTLNTINQNERKTVEEYNGTIVFVPKIEDKPTKTHFDFSSENTGTLYGLPEILAMGMKHL